MHPISLRRRAIGLRSYLTALVTLPILICTALTIVFVSQQVHAANDASDVAQQVETASQLQAVQSDLQSELIPSMALVIFKIPALGQIIGLGKLRASDLGLSDRLVDSLRAKTDAELARLAGTDGERTTARRTRAALATARADIDSGFRISAGFFGALDQSTLLAAESQRVLNHDGQTTGGSTVAQAVRDATLVSTAVRASADELAYLVAYKFPALGAPKTLTEVRSNWLQAWADFQAASGSVVTKAENATVTRWRQTLSAPATATYDEQLGRYATDLSKPLSLTGVVTLFRANVARASSLTDLDTRTSRQAISLASAARSTALMSALLVGGAVALGLLLSMLIAVAIRRKIARPLGELACQADLVSRGELVDVVAVGPREVRTVATGLSAAVASLRRIEAQAAAVASGDLDSDVVREPLPGLLGVIMHNSVATIIDAIHERDLAQRDLAFQAMHDSLTGLPNRSYALTSIEHALQRARRSGDLTVLLFVDLDRFKLINDNLGHAAGDEVLRVCARRMVDVVRGGDTVCRLGGDEFVVLVENVSRDFPFATLAERLIAAVSEPIPIHDRVARVGASVGISLCQDASVDAERLLSEADAAIYSAKAAGRGRVGIFDETLRAELTHRAAAEQALVAALENDELVLHYQPIVEMGSNRPTGYEALIRWAHPTRGLLPPSEFIPIAEKTTLINRIGRWTLDEATRQLARWDRNGDHPAEMSVAVNISGRHLITAELVSDVRAALDASGIAAQRLVVEITETVLIDDPVALDNMQQLRDLGVAVAIDDFGTGYTSIGQLSRLPVDILKIDRSFIQTGEPGHEELVRLIVVAAHAFGLSVVAEGIELAEQADSLKKLDVDTGQGFFFAHPEPAQLAGQLASLERLPAGSDPDGSPPEDQTHKPSDPRHLSMG